MIDQQNSLSEKFLKKGFWLYVFSFIIAPIGYIIKVILSNDLSVEEIGVLYGIISLITLVAGFNDFGMTESLNKFLPQYITEKRYDKVKALLLYALGTQMVTAIIIFFIFFFGANYIGTNYFKYNDAIEAIKIFSFYFILMNIFQVIGTFFMSVQDTLYSKIGELARMLFVLLFILTLFLNGKGTLINYSYAWLIGLIIGIIVGYILFYNKYYKIYLKGIKADISSKFYKKIFKYAIFVFIGAQASTILGQIDMQMIIYMLGSKDAGLYSNYLSLIGIPFLIITPIFGLLFPIFSEMYSKGEIERINLVKNIFEKNFLGIGIAINILFFLFGEIIAYIFFGEKFIMSGTIIKYSALFLAFNFLLQINFNLLASIGKVKERVVIISYAIIINFILNLVFIKLLGVVGSALATGIGWIYIRYMSEIKLGFEYKSKFNLKYVFKNIIFLSLIGIIIYFILPKEFTSISRIYLFFEVIVISIIYFICYLFINYGDFRFLILEIKRLRGK
ncbi:MAG: oligosaccharide flippase family protein [Candidatus Gracilibacteria bacterium]|nr:oligosaccharide flippase family protein [Candidatus Gracilibacteria bacterium]